MQDDIWLNAKGSEKGNAKENERRIKGE